MQGFSPKLPLSKDNTDGLFSMNKTALESINQDLKMLVLTNPGERMMMPQYGVGLRRFLFDQNTQEIKNKIFQVINAQISTYMNFIKLLNVEITDDKIDENAIKIKIEYIITSANSKQQLNLSLSSN